MSGDEHPGRPVEKLRRYWDAQAATYDRSMGFAERRLFADTRAWLCGQASGRVLEVAIGTGLNLPHYSPEVELTGVELSPRMLGQAKVRAAELGRDVELQVADAQALPFPDGRFDTVVCSFALCCIPDDALAVSQLARVLRPGGLLLLADHVRSSVWPVRVLQAAVELVSVPRAGEYWRRRPLLQVEALGFDVVRHDRFTLGLIERLAARKPGEAPG